MNDGVLRRRRIKITNYYEASECKFTELTETLKNHHTRTMNLSELEKLLQEEGRELLRLMLQGHPGEKRNSKRMATVASVYNIDRFIRNPEDFKNELASIKMVKEVMGE